MDTKKLTLGSLAGAVTLFLLGFVFYAVLLESFFNEAAGASASVYKAEPTLWAIFVGELLMAVLVATIFLRWATISTFMGGLKGGAIIGTLLGLGFAFTMFGTTTMMSLPAILVEGVVSAIRFGIAGGVIGWVLGRE